MRTIKREDLIKYFRLNGGSFIQFAEKGHVQVDIQLPEIIEIEEDVTQV